MTTQTALITGGSAGIGLALAVRHLARGDRVLVTGRSAAHLDRAALAHPGLETVVSDVGSPADRERLAAYLERVAPDLDVVVHNAGFQRRVALAVDDAPWSETQQEFETLFGGPVHLDRLLVPRLVHLGRPARVVVVTSGGAFVPQPFAPVYSALKAALHSYVVNLRFALAGTAVRVVELAPPAVATGLSGAADPHGADLDAFADDVFGRLAGDADFVGHGPTATPAFTVRVDAEREAFAALAGRFPVPTWGMPRGV